MSTEDKLFGLKPGFFSGVLTQSLKQLLFLRYGLYESSQLKLRALPHPIVSGVGFIQNSEGERIEDGMIVGTVRMGYGHHRMAYSLYSWAMHMNQKPYLHDLLAFDCHEAVAIKDIDGFYSSMSRASSEMGGVIEWTWGQLMSQGNIGSLQFSLEFAERYVNLLHGIPSDLPYISTYPLNGQIAVAAKFKKVVHLIPDNFPQYYLLVPGALNLVQSPSAYMKFIEMGIPKESLAIAGHWVSHKIASNAIKHSEERSSRANRKAVKRILLAIGGAGAQKNYTLGLISSLEKRLKDEKLQLYINTGDHKGIFAEIREKVNELGIPHTVVETWSDLQKFCEERTLDKTSEPVTPPIVFFHFANYFEAFTATDELICISDILMTKPSELAFFPIPKIFIRRVGDHEAASAFRSMELGEGTVECREVEHAIEMVKLFVDSDEIFHRMNECVIRNSKEGVYDGAKNAVSLAS
ncbi:MAG: hypothetical protein H7A24_14905 [Leptospiraceae bacterium]|nr:hypothetical protein [Leptospiraceae bacterium]MCP5513173.1 hypothetical protein [Leptospiraceae bacterium]